LKELLKFEQKKKKEEALKLKLEKARPPPLEKKEEKVEVEKINVIQDESGRIRDDKGNILNLKPQNNTSLKINQNIKKEEKVPEASGPDDSVKPKAKKKEFPPESFELGGAKFFWEYLREWSPSAKEPTLAGYQAWARDLDAMFRIDHRTPDEFNELLDWIDSRKESIH
jgi:hypothetical protein